MDKKILFKSFIIAGSATALAFSAYRLYLTWKEYHESLIEGEDLELELEARRLSDDLEQREKTLELEVEELYLDDSEEPDETIEYYTGADAYMEQVIALEDDYIDEEEIKLLHEPHTKEALIQFQEMLLADLGRAKTPEDHSTRAILRRLFNVHFIPQTKEDSRLFQGILYERIDFFGSGPWTEYVSIAELLIHFAKLANFDMDIPINDFLEDRIKTLRLYDGINSYDLENIVDNLVSHTYSTRDPKTDEMVYTMFGLDAEMYGEVLDESDKKNEGRRSFMMEYHTYIYYEGEGYYE